MSDLYTVALPYAGARYYGTMPSGVVRNTVEYKLWGAGGGGGGKDWPGVGGDGSGGNFVHGTLDIEPGALIEVFVGQGGGRGNTGSSATGGAGGDTLSGFGGGDGGRSGPVGSSGSGGAGGGATLLIVDGIIRAVAGGGGGGGGGGHRGPSVNGEAANGVYLPTQPDIYTHGTVYPGWSNIILEYAIWEGNGNYTWKVFIPEDGTYTLTMSADDYAEFYIDGAQKLISYHWATEYTVSFIITRGIHNIRIYGLNTRGGPAAIGAKLVDALNSTNIVWHTLFPRNVSSITHGAHGGNRSGDGGGGGGGGGGWYGGISGLPMPDYDNGGFGGKSGANYIPGQTPAITGEYAAYRVPGGQTDSQYPGSIAYGGLGDTYSVTSTAGANGYAILNFAKLPGFFYNNQGSYTPVIPSIKINGSYRQRSIAYTKVSGVWTAILSSPEVLFDTDSEKWGDIPVGLPANTPTVFGDVYTGWDGGGSVDGTGGQDGQDGSTAADGAADGGTGDGGGGTGDGGGAGGDGGGGGGGDG